MDCVAGLGVLGFGKNGKRITNSDIYSTETKSLDLEQRKKERAEEEAKKKKN
jgi:hypothetical protein